MFKRFYSTGSFRSLPLFTKAGPILTQSVLWAPVFLVAQQYLFTISPVEGRSMQPTLNPDSNELKRDIVLLNRWSCLSRKYQVGDVVTFISPANPNKLLVKRIVAMEGDFVRPLPRKLRSIPAQKLPPGTQGSTQHLEAPPLVDIPTGHCWVEGDESFHSNDSNTFGPVPLGLITSKVTWIVWPLNRFGPLPSPPSRPSRVSPRWPFKTDDGDRPGSH